MSKKIHFAVKLCEVFVLKLGVRFKLGSATNLQSRRIHQQSKNSMTQNYASFLDIKPNHSMDLRKEHKITLTVMLLDEEQKIMESASSNEEMAELFTKLGSNYQANNMNRKALEAYNHALDLGMICYGHCHLSVANLLFLIGKIYHLEREYDSAIESYHEALMITSFCLGDESMSLIPLHNALGAVCWENGNTERAVDEWEAAARIKNSDESGSDEKCFMLERVITANSLGNTASSA